ncbi:MAG: hypothetical protein ABGY41_15005 [Candidatus Poribacteria bacterium]
MVALALSFSVSVSARLEGSPVRETWALFLDVGEPAGAPPRPDARVAIGALVERIEEFMGVPRERMSIHTASPLSREAIRESISSLATQVPPGSMVIVHMRAYVTKPLTETAMYFYPGDGDLSAPPPGDPRGIRDTEMVEWFAEFSEDTHILLFLDLRTDDESLMVYFGTRATIGDATVTTIARSDALEPMAAILARLLNADADTDTNSKLGIHEVGRVYQAALYNTGVTSSDAISGMTGEATALTLLPSAIVINGPPGSHAVVDGVEVGDVPYRFEPESTASHEVTIFQAGYRRPEPKTVEITTLVGEGRPANFPMQRIAVGGTVSTSTGSRVGSLVVGLLPDAGLVAEMDGPGEYALDMATLDLAPGTEYRVIAGTTDERHFGDASFVYGGHDDITVDIALEERTLWQVASIYYGKGFVEEALSTAATARQTDLDVPADLDAALAAALVEAWSDETLDPRAMIVCARITERTYGVKQARGYWKLAKAAAIRNTNEHRVSTAGYRASGSGLLPYAVTGLCLLAASGLVAGVRRRRRAVA